MLYAVRRVSGQYTLMGLDLETFTQNGGGQLAPLAASITGSSLGQHGLLPISPDGRELAMVSGSGSPMGMFMWATANIHRYNLSADHTQATFLSTYSEANAAFHYMDYSPQGQYLYYTRTGLTLGSATHQIMRQNLSNAVVSPVSGRGGDIRRTKHGTMLVATPAWLYADEAFTISNPNGASPTVAWGNFTGSAGRGEAAIGLQPLVYELLPAISTRSLNQKRYELTDHLGNVRAVVSDRKLCDNSALPTPPVAYRAEVLNQTDYYPFGMISRSTVANGEEYRFGFQGQEKDDEIHGAPGTSVNYEFRMHDARVGRFLSLDPLAAKYPYNSPFAFSENRVIDMIELEGLEAADTPDKEAMDPNGMPTSFGVSGGASDLRGGWMEEDDSSPVEPISSSPTPPTIPVPSFPSKPSSTGQSGLRNQSIYRTRPNFSFEYKKPESEITLGSLINVQNTLNNKYEFGSSVTLTMLSLTIESELESQFKYKSVTSKADDVFTKYLSRAAPVLSILQKGLGVSDMIDHGSSAYDDFTKRNYKDCAINTVKLGLDIVFNLSPAGKGLKIAQTGFGLIYGYMDDAGMLDSKYRWFK